MESSKEVYCICGQPYDNKRFMIQCDACREWFHGSCVGVWEYVTIDLDKYHCPQCESSYGPSLFKKQFNFHRHNYSDTEADSKPVQTGTPVFINELKTRHFHSADAVIVYMQGSELTLPYLHQNGFDQPIMVKDKEGLQILVPPEDFHIHQVSELIGTDRMVDVIDVCRQSDIKMRFGDFVNYFVNPNRVRVLNLISLEFTNTKLADLVEAPYIARKLDWVNSMWPNDIDDDDTQYKKPEVQKYCLIGVKDSYTDFHIDFGGTSVWYHVLKGEKIFYLIKPTHANLSLYQRWMTSSTQYETFFGDQVDVCYKCTVRAGNTMFIPTGWIHAVLTPVDSIVFGGNFLHSLNIPMQLQIYEIEKKNRTPERFRFPAFETINWYAAKRLCEELKDINEEGSKVPSHLLVGVKALLFTLKQWSQDKDTNKSRREEIPLSVQGPKLLKDLSKEIRHAERYLNSLNPPKPERESKRKKRKPVYKDFVDYSQPQANIVNDQIKMEVKEPLKLSIKVLNNKKFRLSSEENKVKPKFEEDIKPLSPVSMTSLMPGPVSVRPPLKLTLPKPATYPYSTSITSEKEDSKSWFVAMDSSPHVKMKKERGDLKVKLAKQPPELPQKSHQSHNTVNQVQSSHALRPFSTGFQKVTDSVYDFHDDSEGMNDVDDNDDDDNCLTIDENPRKNSSLSNAFSRNSNLSSEPLRVKFTTPSTNNSHLNLGSVFLKAVSSGEMEIGGEVDVVSDLPKNGIEELLKASCYTRDQSPKIEDLGSGRASPSTREAIALAGMLSIAGLPRDVLGENSDVNGNSSLTASNSKPKRKKALTTSAFVQDEFEDKLDNIHQDDEYIYPSLDLSDDEEFTIPRSGKKKVDEAWSPRAKVGHVAPKTDRPAREGARKQAVEKVLEAAAAKKSSVPPSVLAISSDISSKKDRLKRLYHRKKTKVLGESSGHKLLNHQSSLLSQTSLLSQLPSTSSSSSAVVPVKTPASEIKSRKPKKGMATAKQRLGKILKIHKMIH